MSSHCPLSSYVPYFPFQLTLHTPVILLHSMPHPSQSFSNLAQLVCLEQPCPQHSPTLANFSMSFKLQLSFAKFLIPQRVTRSPCYISASREPNSSLSSYTIWEAYLTVFCQETVNSKRARACQCCLSLYPHCLDGTQITCWLNDCLFSQLRLFSWHWNAVS